MGSFSQRGGFEPIELPLQFQAISDRTRTRLWNVLDTFIWQRWHKRTPLNAPDLNEQQAIHVLMNNLCHNYFHWALDTMPRFDRGARDRIKDIFFEYRWNQVFDFLEFIAFNLDHAFNRNGHDLGLKLAKHCNDVLTTDNSAYRFIELEIRAISNEQELETVRQACQSPIDPVRTHLKTALKLFSNYENPDYRNSVKESISSVEAMCQTIAGKNASLGDCLKLVKKQFPIHGAFEAALGNLYGYTSDGEGIRHSLNDKATGITAGDAKFMLVTCSAFVNYLVAIAASTGIELKTPNP